MGQKKEILVIGSPKAECKNCRNAEVLVKDYLKKKDSSKFNLQILVSTDPSTKKFGMISTPAIIVDNEVLSLGKALTGEEVSEMFSPYDLG